jgi:Pentapeptide repeats (9 copies)
VAHRLGRVLRWAPTRRDGNGPGRSAKDAAAAIKQAAEADRLVRSDTPLDASLTARVVLTSVLPSLPSPMDPPCRVWAVREGLCVIKSRMAEEEATREPDWPVCGRGGCIGVLVEGQEACLAHLGSCARKLALAALAPGAGLDLRGMPIDAELLQQVLAALRPGDGPAKVGDVRFDRAQFSGIAVFEGVRFAGEAWFEEARFSGEARFDKAQFSERAVFRGVRFDEAAVFNSAQFDQDAEFLGAEFTGMAWFVEAKFAGMAAFTDAWSKERAAFSGAQFLGTAGFGRTRFSGISGFEETRFEEVWFGAAQFGKEARFGGTVFSGAAAFTGTQFGGVADFTGAQFTRTVSLGPLFADALILDRATFEQPVTIRVVSGMLSCVDTRFDDTATLRLRYAEAVLYRAVFTKPSTIVFAENAFEPRDELPEETFDEGAVARATRGRSPRPRLLSLHGTDVATLTLTELDLGACVF